MYAAAASDRDAIGVYGKIPAQGDFVRVNAADAAAQSLDLWVQENLESMQRTGLEFPQAPTFFMHHRMDPATPVTVGALCRSHDRVGRVYPMVVFARVEPAWIASFLLRPTDLRPALRATMPRLALRDAEARDLAAYLTADPDPALPPLAAPSSAQIALGRSLFRQLDCARCHGFRDAVAPIPAPPPTDENRLAPDLSRSRERVRLGQLAAWIRWPARLKPATTMPALTRSDDEAVALASYIALAPLAPAPTVAVPPMLPPLPRRVAWPEVAEAVFLRTCRHCHADASVAFGEGGPGNTGGFGFAARRLELATYAGAMSGMMAGGERQSAFAVDDSGMPRLVHALRARQLEEAGVVDEGIRGMPLGHPSLTPEALQLVTSWIASGRPVE